MRVLSGLAWQGAATVAARAARSLTWFVLGALLSPRDFGAFAAIFVVVEGLYVLQDMGLPQALIVRRTRIEESAQTTFVLTMALGVAFAAAAWLFAPVVAAFYADPSLTLPFRILGVVLVLHAVRIVPLRLFERALDFRSKVGPTVAGSIAYVVVAIGGAFLGWGVWALVGAVVANAAVETAAYWIVSPWRPGGGFGRDVAREDVRFGLPVVGAAVLAYTCLGVDRLLLGRFASPEALGAYAFALSLAMLPSGVGSSVANTVLLPSYRRLGDDPAAVRNLHFRALAVSGGFNLLFLALILALAGPLLQSFYGAKWDAALAPLRVLVAAGLLRSLASLSGELLLGAGRPQDYRAINLTHLLVVAAGLPFALARGSIEGVAWAMAAGAGAATGHAWLLARRPLECSVAAIARVLAPGVVAFMLATAAGLALRAAAPAAAGIAPVAAIGSAQAAVFLAIWWRLDARLRGGAAGVPAPGVS